MRTFQLILILSFFVFRQANGCSCDGFKTISIEDILYHDVIFKGEIIELQISKGQYEWDDRLQATFLIQKKIYPKIIQDTVIVYTNIGEAACGLDFKIGDTWLIFGDKESDNFYASFCSKSIVQKPKNIFRFYKRKHFAINLSQKSGLIKSKVENYIFSGQLDNGLPQGLWIKTNQSDTVELMPFLNGLHNGLWIRRFENGKSRIETNYVNGKREGIFKQFNKENILVYYIEYSNDKKNGIYKDFNDNGDLYEIGQYKQDKPVGEWKRYINGKLYYKFFYDDNGVKTNRWEKYDDNGNLIEKNE